jgi:hypothetical protein
VALPQQYTEPALAAYMLSVLGDLAGTLGIDEYVALEAVNDALLLYGTSDIAQATDMRRLRGAARLAVWRMAHGRVVSLYGFTADGATYNRQHVAAQVKDALLFEEANAGALGLDSAGGVWAVAGSMVVADPYRVHTSFSAEGVD